MLSNIFHPKQSRACSPLPMGTEWPVADGPSSGLLTHPWIRNIPKREDSLSVPDTSAAKEHRLL